ncbi:MAG: hypothetical protein AAB441_00960 [Patescibacteria group bacterium]
MYTQRNKYWPAYTWKIQTSYSSEIKNRLSPEIKISEDDFGIIYFNIFNKINASFYHLEKLKESQEIAVNLGKALSTIKIPGTKNIGCIAASYYEPVQYEYEAFLVIMKSSLDFISILISNSIGRKDDTITNLSEVAKSRTIRRSPFANKLYSLTLINPFSKLINEFKNSPNGKKSKRNFGVHIGSLPIGSINVPIDNPSVPILLSKAFDPYEKNLNFNNAPDLIEYCESMFYTTCDLFIKVLSIFTRSNLKPGQKMSIYELKKSYDKRSK